MDEFSELACPYCDLTIVAIERVGQDVIMTVSQVQRAMEDYANHLIKWHRNKFSHVAVRRG